MGYRDLRDPAQIPTQPPSGTAWQEKLSQVALTFLADTNEKADEVARQLHYIDGKT